MNEESIVKSRVNSQLKISNGILTEQDLKNAYLYFDGLCPYSDTPISDRDWHIEHIIPVKMGGTTDPWNCIPVCAPCNLSKGGKHLLDWWHLRHKPEEEYKLEKIFTYILEELNKPRNYQITTKDQELISKLLKEEQELENQDEDILYNEEDKIHLDTFTFLYQLLNHLISNKQYIKGNIEEYVKILQETYNNNLQYERLDTELFKLQNQLVSYLKSIGVTQHYSIAFTYSKKISNLDEVKNNINSIKKYLQTNNISDLINKNPDIILMTEVEFSSKLEYIVNILNIPLNTFLEKPTIINQLEQLKELYSYCINENIDFNNIPNYIFVRKRIKDISKIVEVCKANKIEITGSVLMKSADEIQRIIEACKANKIEITGSVLMKKSQDLNETINYLKLNHGDEYLKQLLIVISTKKIKEIFPYLDSLGVLPTVITSASILRLSLDEIKERKQVLDTLGEPMVVGNRYNSIFGLSKKNYQKKLESLNINNQKKR